MGTVEAAGRHLLIYCLCLFIHSFTFMGTGKPQVDIYAFIVCFFWFL